MGKVLEINDSQFGIEVLEADVPVLVDFWAPQCGPCRLISPIVEELAGENKGVAKVVKIDIDENRGVVQNYAIHSIPTLMVFKDGEVVERFAGLQPKSKLQAALDSAKSGIR